MVGFIVSVLPEIVGGIMAIICAVIGAKIATSATKNQARRSELMDAYAALFAAYYALVADEWSERKSVQFIAAAESTRLLCSQKADRIIAELVPLFTADPLPLDKMSKCMHQLQEAARDDLRHTGS